MLGPDFGDEEPPVFDGWTVVEKLGEGGMCAVYRARPTSGDGPERAIKVLTDLSTNAIRRFTVEAELLERIDHPNVIRVHHLERDARPPWIVMDLLRGKDLEETREAEGPLSPERAARLFADLASGLASVHALGVRHRDIKPANIILSEDGVARLIDFGIARQTGKAHVTAQGFVVGTAAYLPPEIFVEEDAHGIQDSESADVYALGQTLYEVLTGMAAHPPDKGTQATLLVQIMRDKMERPHLDPRLLRPQVPKGLASVVKRATAQEPTDRIQTAAALEEALRGWLETRTSLARVAPVSVVDPDDLPAPPNTGDQELPAPGVTLEPTESSEAPDSPEPPSVPPPPAPPVVSRATPGPAIARTAAAGAVGLGGMALLAGGLAFVLVIGLVALVLLRPASPHDEVEAVVQARWPALTECRRGEEGELLLSLTVEGGDAHSVKVIESDLPKRVDSCVRKVMGKAAYPPHREAYTVEVPIRFR